jgi:hypothetical protein
LRTSDLRYSTEEGKRRRRQDAIVS